MKKLTLIRHAKSNWKHPSLPDHDRPLSKRGERDAPELGRRYLEHGARLDRIYCSTASRARATALLFLDAMGLDDSRLTMEEKLYLATKEFLLGFISELQGGDSQVAIVGHNPGMSQLVRQLSDIDLGDMPTCTVVQLTFDVSSWPEVPAARPVETWHDYPQRTWGN